MHVSLAHGIPASWDQYQRMVGEYQGLQLALDMIDSMLEEEKNQDWSLTPRRDRAEKRITMHLKYGDIGAVWVKN